MCGDQSWEVYPRIGLLLLKSAAKSGSGFVIFHLVLGEHQTAALLSNPCGTDDKMLKSSLSTIQGTIHLTYLVLDGHFGNHPAFHMVRQCQLHLISKLRYDAALHFAYSGPSLKRGPRPRLGEQVDVRNIPEAYLRDTKVEDGFETRTYQMQLLHKDFPDPLNVVILLRTNLTTTAWANVILFSSDLELSYDKLIDYYSLRFQIEFDFRDAKQFWGLEDFMNVTPTAVTNAANLALFMTDVSQMLMCQYRQDDPNSSCPGSEGVLPRLPICDGDNTNASAKTR